MCRGASRVTLLSLHMVMGDCQSGPDLGVLLESSKNLSALEEQTKSCLMGTRL